MDKLGFHIKERGSNIGREILAGVILFLCTCYLIPTNASIVASSGMDEAGLYAASAIATFICTFLFAIIANVPMIVATGMGLNSLFAQTIVIELGYSWQEAMFIVFLAGIAYFILSITPAREKILHAFPENLKLIISAGLGVFIAFVGFTGGGIIVKGDSAILSMGDLTSPSVLISILGIIFVLAFSLIKTKRGWLKTFAVPISMLLVASIGLTLSGIGLEDPSLPRVDFSSGWGINNLDKVVLFGTLDKENPSDFISIISNVFSNPLTYVLIFSIVVTNLLNSTATFLLIGRDTGMINEEGKIASKKYVIADSVGGIAAGLLGSTPTCTLAESAIPVGMNAKTGLCSLTAASLFLLSAFIYPIFQIFSYGSVTCCALVYIGASVMSNNLRKLEWDKVEASFSAFFCIIMIIGTYSLNYGIGIAIIIYILISLFQGKYKDIHPLLYIFSLVYLASFVLEAILL